MSEHHRFKKVEMIWF